MTAAWFAPSQVEGIPSVHLPIAAEYFSIIRERIHGLTKAILACITGPRISSLIPRMRHKTHGIQQYSAAGADLRTDLAVYTRLSTEAIAGSNLQVRNSTGLLLLPTIPRITTRHS